jgi:uncharacterized protein YndB with AHSA1/START domain
MDINADAPVKAESSAEIPADAETLWDLVANVEHWPEWNPDVKSVTLDGGIQPGSIFRWKTRTGTIASTFQVVERPHALAWTGKALGLRAIHVWRFEQRGDTTLVTTAESFEGPVARLFRRTLQKTLDKALRGGLRMLTTAAEKPQPGPA